MGVEEDHRTTAREAVTPVLQYFIFHIKPMQIWIGEQNVPKGFIFLEAGANIPEILSLLFVLYLQS